MTTTRELETLSIEECYGLRATEPVGRLVFQDADGPVALPVNYTVSGHDVLLRVDGDAGRVATDHGTVAFEADHVDPEDRSGWSVLVRGQGQALPLSDVPSPARGLTGRFPHPWASGPHDVLVRLHPTSVTGRRLGRAT